MARIKIDNQNGVPEVSFSGVDIRAFINIPLLNLPEDENPRKTQLKLLGELQTVSLSSTRSISPVRVLGRSSPLSYTRGARTFAGTMVFATLDRDPFYDIARSSVTESYDGASSLFVDRLPPFSILITASNELGGVAQQVISGITLVSYGTTYSIDDIYTESTYTYVATDVTPLLPSSELAKGASRESYKTPTDKLEEHYLRRYGTVGGNKVTGNRYFITPGLTVTAAEITANTLGLTNSTFWQDNLRGYTQLNSKVPVKVSYYSTVMG